ncbi:F-box protein PP2-B10 [Abeliophyllum distichum]|uniref:F-box protein PP2-B10 n=1 Tax=Abeliophyllum distichum TaxID=126358 RepID=A0ABD1RQR7_9LAMI
MHLIASMLLQSFSLVKGTGNKCFMLPARDLLNGWGKTPKYWQWISLPESRFPEVAELLDLRCWSDICCKINTSMLSSGTKYAAYLVFTSRSRIYGFQNYPLEALVGISVQEVEKRIVCLNQENRRTGTSLFPGEYFSFMDWLVDIPNTPSVEMMDGWKLSWSFWSRENKITIWK